MTTKTKSTLFSLLWMFVFFVCTLVAFLILGDLVRHRTDLPHGPKWGLLYSFLPFTPLMTAGLAFFMSRFGWLPGTRRDEREAA